MFRRSTALGAIAILLAVLMAMPASAATRPAGDSQAQTAALPGLDGLTDLTDLLDLGDLTDVTDLTDLADLADLADLGDLTELTDLLELGDLTDLLDLGDITDVGDLLDLGSIADLGDFGSLVELALGQLDGLGLGELTNILDVLPGLDLLGNLPAIPVEDCLAGLDDVGAEIDDAAAAVLGLEIVQCVLGGLPDIVGSPHASAIVKIVTDGIATGFTDATYRPNHEVTRGQMAAFLARALELPAAPGGTFTDVLGHAHRDAIGAVVDAGIAQGFADGTFRPNALVTRGQMASFLARALELSNASPTGLSDVLGDTHAASIGSVVDAGIAQGFPDGTFRPQHWVTRGQMATFLARALAQ